MSRGEGRRSGPNLILAGNALVGLLLAFACGAILLANMRAQLEEELVKRSAAACRATAADLEYSATVADGEMAGRRMNKLAQEPTAQVSGAWLSVDGAILAKWTRDPSVAAPPDWLAGQGGGEPRFVELGGSRQVVIGCPVVAISGHAGAVLPALPNAGRLLLLVDAAEISGTVRRGVVGALGVLCLAILIAMGLQLAVALSVIGRANESLRQLREAQARLLKADKLAAVGTLAAGVAHEINNPLAYVIANLEYCARMVATEAPAGAALADLREALAEASQGAERVRVIVADLKAVARGGQEQTAPLDVRQVAEASINLAMAEIKPRATLVCELGPVSLVEANEVRLGQVVTNVLINAAQAIPEGAAAANRITLATRMTADHRVAIEIRDTGVGIPAANVPRLFEPFFTTKPIGKGTGLGLWVCHDIIHGLGGEIAVESEEGKGTVFRILLPARADRGPQPVRSGATSLAPG